VPARLSGLTALPLLEKQEALGVLSTVAPFGGGQGPVHLPFAFPSPTW